MSIETKKSKYSDERLGTESITALLFKMGMPAVAAQIINLLYNIVDRMYIGHIPEVGDVALTGVGLSIPIVVLLAAFASFVGGGGTPLATIALGRGDREKAEKILGNSGSMLAFFSVLLFIVFYLTKGPLLYLIGASDNTFSYANDYISLYLIGTPFVLVTVGLNSYISAQGRAGIAMLTTFIGAVVNIALDPLFIYTFSMGVKGAAIATVISQAVSSIWIIGFLTGKKASLRLKLSLMRPDLEIIKGIAGLGIAPFVMTATESFISIVMNSGLQKYGGDVYVGALTVAQSSMQFITVPVNGFGQGVTPVISYNYGAGNAKRVKQAFKQLFIILYAYTAGFAIVEMAFPKLFAMIFSDKAELQALSARVLPIFIAGMLVFGIQRACQTTFLALGQAKTSLFIALLRKVFLLIPFALIFPLFGGVMGIYYAEPVADTLAALTCGSIFLVRFPGILGKLKEKQPL